MQGIADLHAREQSGAQLGHADRSDDHAGRAFRFCTRRCDGLRDGHAPAGAPERHAPGGGDTDATRSVTGDAATHLREELSRGTLEATSLLTASLTRDQAALRSGAFHRGLSGDLMWLVAELAVSPFAHALQRMLFGGLAPGDLQAALDAWGHGYCPACGSWPAVGEVAGGHRTLRCSFCACAWELKTYACIYCGNDTESFVTAAPDTARTDRRIEICSGCGGYLKTLDVPDLSPFPLLSISDIETTDLDVAAMEHGYARPGMKEFGARKG